MCPGKMMVQFNFMANRFQGPILLIWSIMSLDIVKAVNLFAEGLRDMNIPQDVIGNRERWDWMHRAPETPETDYITPKQKRTIRKTASRIPVSVRSAKSLSVWKRIKDHFASPALLSATKKRIKEEFSSPWVSYN